MSKAAATTVGRTVWRMRLQSAFRTAMASTAVGCTTLYGPEVLKRHLTFPSFSYATAILIVCDGNLGHTIRGCWHAFYATIQVIPLTMLSVRLIGLNRFFPFVGALAVAVISFVVALPEPTPLMSKRIAFGQLVTVYVNTVIHRDNPFRSRASLHPLHVAESTALGAISALLAMLIPYPRLAYCEVRELCRLYAENVAERLNLIVQALSTEGRASAPEFIARAKPLYGLGNKILHSITLVQEDIVWERPWTRLSRPQSVSPGNRLRALETPTRGMEIALDGGPPLTPGSASEDMDNLLLGLSRLFTLKAEQARCLSPVNSTTVPELKTESIGKISLPYQTVLSTYQDRSACFFLSCAQQLIDDPNARQIPETVSDISVQERKQLKELASLGFKKFCSIWFFKLRKDRLICATKCSLSLGLAVLIGLLFDKENAYWSGLTIAISFVEERQALFTVANARAQGTAIGSVYGVLGCFIFKRVPKIRFLALFPWILFTSFLMHSRMYGQGGGTSAAIAALLILGRHNYGLPDEFAIARLTEAVIGLCCFIVVELLFQSNKASSLAKKQLYVSLLTLQGCMKQLILSSTGDSQPSIRLQALRESNRNFSSIIRDLENFIQEADIEPNFSLLPFQSSRYKRLHHSLSTIADLLGCMSHSLEYLLLVSQDHIAPWNEVREHIHKDLEVCKENLESSLKCLEKISPDSQGKTCQDEEKGNFQTPQKSSAWNADDAQSMKFGSSLLQHTKNVHDSLNDFENQDELKGKRLVSSSALVFCMSYITQEIKGIERGIKALIHWE